MSRSPHTRLDPEVRRELILDAAERAMVDRVPSEVTFEEIAKAAGVSRGLVYNYFNDRTGLLVALASRTLDRLAAELDDALGRDGSAASRLRAVGDAYASFARVNADSWRLIARSGLLDHPVVLDARRRRIEALGALWGEGDAAALRAWAVTALYETAVLEPPPPPSGRGALTRLVGDVIGGGADVAGSSDGIQARHADRPLDPVPGGPGH